MLKVRATLAAKATGVTEFRLVVSGRTFCRRPLMTSHIDDVKAEKGRAARSQLLRMRSRILFQNIWTPTSLRAARDWLNGRHCEWAERGEGQGARGVKSARD